MNELSHHRILVCGGAGFIGSAFVRLLRDSGIAFRVLDSFTYAGNPANLEGIVAPDDVIAASICDADAVTSALQCFRPDIIVNFAAESHVDRSVDDPAPFITTNIAGTQTLLECARRYGALHRFVQVSTDEVYGDLDIDRPDGMAADAETERLLGRPAVLYGSGSFSELSPLRPSSPYSASKASADLMTMAYAHTYALPAIVTRCSNNYGPRQFPEKLIPLMINNMLEHKELPVYGTGSNVRDWIYVDDHCRGILRAAVAGKNGEIYDFGGYSEKTNLEIVHRLIDAVAAITGDPAVNTSMIRFVGDRPGHDRRYAIDARKTMRELGWRPVADFDTALADTARWYIDNRRWVEDIVNGDYRDYYNKMYGNR